MTDKIKPLFNKKSFGKSVKVYDEIFRNSSWYVKNKLKARGIHDVIANYFFKKIKNKNVLDIGCGYGRFCFIVDKYAKSVTGIDRNTNSIHVANDIKDHNQSKKINFYNTSIEDFNPKKKFDFILLSGTLEHIIDKKVLIKKISKLLNKNGLFVSDSPSEFNIRGMIHGGLWKLFDFPMTLSDVDIITPFKMKKLFLDFGIEINEKNIGTLYSRGWGENSLYDLITRLPNVNKDLKAKDKKMDLESFFEWYSEGNVYFKELYEYFIKKKLLKKIKPFKNRKNIINKKFKSKFISFKDAYDYMEPNFEIDPYFSDEKILSNLSGNIIYYGKKK